MTILAIIIEDEPYSKTLLGSILKENCQDIKVVGTGDSIDQGVELINNLKPDLVFLDIEIQQGNAFDLLDRVDTRGLQIVFTTAHRDFAIKAIKYNAIDFVLKPYVPQEICTAVDKVKERIHSNKVNEQLRNISDRLDLLEKSTKLAIKTFEGLVYIPLQDILRIEADRSYCNIIIVDGKKMTVSKPLKNIEINLPKTDFYRTHASHLVNLSYVTGIQMIDGGGVIMKDGSLIPLARRRKNDFITAMASRNNR